jgi:two-component system response regulator RegX3
MHTASLSGAPLRLRRRGFHLLLFLTKHNDRFVSRREILREVWDDHRGTGANTLNVHLSRIRAKLGESPRRPIFVSTCRDRGIMFTAQRAHTFSSAHRLYVPRTSIAAVVRAA